MKGRGLPVEEFEWPCDRRDAHGGHWTEDHQWCLGVDAHPLTMIGGAYRPSS